MGDEHFVFKTWYEDELGWKHHLYVEQFLGVNDNIFYHCIIDGTKTIDIVMVEEKWQDVLRMEGELAQRLGNIIEKYTY